VNQTHELLCHSKEVQFSDLILSLTKLFLHILLCTRCERAERGTVNTSQSNGRSVSWSGGKGYCDHFLESLHSYLKFLPNADTLSMIARALTGGDEVVG
jgi:hypothetical protein